MTTMRMSRAPDNSAGSERRTSAGTIGGAAGADSVAVPVEQIANATTETPRIATRGTTTNHSLVLLKGILAMLELVYFVSEDRWPCTFFSNGARTRLLSLLAHVAPITIYDLAGYGSQAVRQAHRTLYSLATCGLVSLYHLADEHHRVGLR
jgi:hypothetical protein